MLTFGTAASPTGREVLFASFGICVGVAIAHAWRQGKRRHWRRNVSNTSKHVVNTVKELRASLPSGKGGSNVDDALKVRSYLDEQMVEFVSRSPFLQLATADAAGLPFVSPKGDAPGFVEVIKDAAGRGVSLLIPDRPGNRLLFGLQNVVEGSGQVGLLFEIPNNDTTLRCGGRATLSKDPEILRRLSARGLDAKMATRVEVDYAFFHCAKAYMRSKLWDPSTWPEDRFRVCFGTYFADSSKQAEAVDAEIDQEYQRVAASVEGMAAEPE